MKVIEYDKNKKVSINIKLKLRMEEAWKLEGVRADGQTTRETHHVDYYNYYYIIIE